MPENTANFEASGEMARHVSTSVLKANGLDDEDVEAIRVRLVTDCGDETYITFGVEGADAGRIAAQMFNGLDFEEDVPVSVDVSLDGGGGDIPGQQENGDGRPEIPPVADDVEDPPDDEEVDGAPEPAVEDGGDGGVCRSGTERPSPDDYGTEQSPAVEPVQVNRGTGLHRALALVAKTEASDKLETPATAKEIYGAWDTAFHSYNQLSSALSRLFRHKGFLDRERTSAPGGGIGVKYQMDEAAWEELERLGWPPSFPESDEDAADE